MRIGTRARLRLRLLVPLAVVVSLSLPMAAVAETEPDPARHAYINAPDQSATYAGHPFTIEGRLRTASERVSPTATLHVVRTLEGVATALPDVITAEDGTFTLGDSHAKAGVLAYYRLSWDGDDAHDPTTRSLSVFFKPVPVTISLQAAPASPTALDPVTISGSLSLGAGEQVSSPVDLTVQRRASGGSLSRVDLPPVTTDPDGTFEFTDLAPGGVWLYEVTFAGDDTHERRTTTLRIDARYLQVQVSVELAAGETVRWGQLSRYVGRVTAREGPPISSPLTITASNTCPGLWIADSVRATTTPEGVFEFSIRPACPHESVLSVRSWREADRESASATWTDSVAKGPAMIRLDPGTTATAWREPILVQASVHPLARGRALVDYYAKPYGRTKVRVHREWLTNGEGPGFTYYPERRTVITAVYHGDEALLPGSRSVVLYVRPWLGVTISGYDSNVNGWRVFRHRTDVPHIGAHLTPAHPGQRLTVVIQKRINDGWRTVVSRSLRQDRTGSIETEFKGLQGAGNRYRVRNTWAGDADHLAASGPWRYFRFTV